MKIRIRYEKLGGHYHCAVFSSHNGGTFAKLGDIVLDERDFIEMAGDQIEIEMLEKGDETHVIEIITKEKTK